MAELFYYNEKPQKTRRAFKQTGVKEWTQA
jgi:hypothetical protein